MSVPLLHRIGNRLDYIYRSSCKPTATKRSGLRNQLKRCLRAGPEHAISYTWQLASNVAIIYPDSRLLVQMAALVEVRPICSCSRQPARKRTRVARGSSSVWVIANMRRNTAAWRDRVMICQLDWLPMSFYFALAGGTMSFIRRYSTIWP